MSDKTHSIGFAFGRRLLQVLLAWILIGEPTAIARADFLGHGASVRDVAISADGFFAATAGFDDVAILWSVEDRMQIARFYGHEAAVNAAAFLPPQLGSMYPRIATVSDDGSGRIWDGDSGALLVLLDGHSKKVVAVATSPDGRSLATASWDRTVRLWDAETGSERQVFEGHRNSFNDVLFTLDGGRIYAGGMDPVVRGWYANSGVSVIGETTAFQPIDRVPAGFADSEDPVERGSYPGYIYSNALRISDAIWTGETVSRLFEIGPDKMFPGTKMPIQRLADLKDRLDLIEFLKVATEPGG